MQRDHHHRAMGGATGLLILLTAWLGAAVADEAALAEQQKKLNEEVLAQPFFAEQPEKVEAYIQEMTAKKQPPEEYKGTHWRPGYTCRDLLRYSWREYRNCRYYYHWHGRYYPYYY